LGLIKNITNNSFFQGLSNGIWIYYELSIL
jgi:hypothetical protein